MPIVLYALETESNALNAKWTITFQMEHAFLIEKDASLGDQMEAAPFVIMEWDFLVDTASLAWIVEPDILTVLLIAQPIQEPLEEAIEEMELYTLLTLTQMKNQVLLMELLY